jgi:hypothetical protein
VKGPGGALLVDIANVEAYVGLRFSPAQFDAAGVRLPPNEEIDEKKMPTADLTAPRAALLPDDDRSAVKLDTELEDPAMAVPLKPRLRSGLFLVPAAAVSLASESALFGGLSHRCGLELD